MKNDRARADHRVVADLNGAEQNRSSSRYRHCLRWSDSRRGRSSCQSLCNAEGRNCVPRTRSFMHDQSCPVIKSQTGPDLRLEIEFDAKSPFHVEHVAGPR